MAVKTANAKKSTVKKGLKGVSASKVKRTASAGSRKMSELDKTAAMMRAGHAEVEAELKDLMRVIKESERARLKDLEQREKDREERKERDEKLNRWMGGLRTSIGSIVEMVLLPGLSEKMNEYGHKFTKSSYRIEFKREDRSKLAEVDLLLENGGAVMVVEAKALFNADGVDALLNRVQKLRADEKLTGMAGKTIFAAAAGVKFTDEACQMIKDKGIYLVTVNEDDDKILISPLSIEKAGKW